jgi:ferredoxin
VLINLPKLKTHAQMLLTLGVKNLFGCIVGLRKPEWHFRTGVDRQMFAGLLVKIHTAINPSVTLLDGILAMEGQGPGKGGLPRQLGVVMGSDSAIALDMAVCRMVGIAPDGLFTNRAAREMGFDDPIDIIGDLPLINDFKFPSVSPIVFGPPQFHGFMRRHLVQRPVVDLHLCKACGECSQYCPAKAISPKKEGLVFDYEKCIRCYCCIEVCPHAALKSKETITGKIARKFLKP